MRVKKIFDPAVITIDHAFHGHTLGASGASNIPRIKKGFEPLLSEFIYAPFNDPNAISN